MSLIVGNQSVSAVAANDVGFFSQNFSAPWDGTLTSASAQIRGEADSLSSDGTLAGVSFTVAPTGGGDGPPFTLTVSCSLHVTGGTTGTIAIQRTTGPVFGLFFSALGPSNPNIWGTFTPAGGAPLAPVIEAWNPSNATDWNLLVGVGASLKYVGELDLQASYNGGSTWTTLASLLDSGSTGLNGQTHLFTVTPSAGAVEFRALSINTQDGSSTPSTPVVVAAAPSGTVSTSALTALTMGSWQIAFPAGFVNAGAYNIQRSTDGGSTWTTLSTLTTGAAYIDTGAPAGALAYRWQGVNSVGVFNGPTNTATVPAIPAAPTITPLTMTSWRVDFAAVANGVQYLVQRSTDGGSTWTTIFTTTSAFTYTDTAVSAGALAYRIQAQDSVGNTNGATATATAPATPGFPTLTEVLN